MTTAIGAEGFPMDEGVDYLLEETPSEFAAAIVWLFDNVETWTQLSANSKKVVASYSPGYKTPGGCGPHQGTTRAPLREGRADRPHRYLGRANIRIVLYYSVVRKTPYPRVEPRE